MPPNWCYNLTKKVADTIYRRVSFILKPSCVTQNVLFFTKGLWPFVDQSFKKFEWLTSQSLIPQPRCMQALGSNFNSKSIYCHHGCWPWASVSGPWLTASSCVPVPKINVNGSIFTCCEVRACRSTCPFCPFFEKAQRSILGPKKHGNIGYLGHWNQNWGQKWPLRPLTTSEGYQ